jgi:signal transduction histidine kinase
MSDSPPGGQRPEPAGPGDPNAAGRRSDSPLAAVLPPLLAMAVLGVIVAVALAVDSSSPVVIGVAVGGVLVAALVVTWAISGIRGVERRHREEVRRLRGAAEQNIGAAQASRHHQAEVERLRGILQRLYEIATQWPAQFAHDIDRFAAQVRAGERPVPQEPEAGYVDERDPFARLEREHRAARYAAELAIVRAAETNGADDGSQRLQVFANLGRRLQSLVNREIQMLDELEKQIEDPEVLEGIFAVDHLATRIRRQAENLCVLGGARAPRQWSKPLTMVTTLRSAMQEVEFYKRVKMVLPINGTLRGHNVTEIIHLLAELIENATAFSAPETTVLLSAQNVTAGLAIEVEDRGLGVNAEDLDRINDLLASPGGADVGVLLSDGRQIGLWVAAQLARRNDVRVRLSRNIFGGTTAAVVVPHVLLGEETEPAATPAAVEPAAEPRHGVRTEYAQPAALPPAAALSDTQQFAPAIAAETPGVAARANDSSPALEPVADPHAWPNHTGQHEPVPAHATGDTVNEEQRPRLPKRQPGTNHLAPELRSAPSGYDSSARFTPPAGLQAGLPGGPPAAGSATERGLAAVAAFRSGIRAGSTNDETTAAPVAPAERTPSRGESTHHDR